jgi:uncharacterized protein (TIGR02145 family)
MAQNVGTLTADTNAIFEALRAKGVNVPTNAQLSDVADMIESIVPPHQNEVEIGGRLYPYVQIGNQLWMAENLDYVWEGLVVNSGYSYTEPKCHYYNNDEATYGVSGNKYGLLYNYSAIAYLNTNKTTLLPDGWHVPSISEIDTMINTVGGTSVAGTKLKSTSDWTNDANGTDDYGLNVKPAGSADNSGFGGLGTNANIASYTAYQSDRYRTLNLYTGVNATLAYTYRVVECSIRLVKDVT